ncbi:MAG: TolC family protein [Dysgonamonadaceae bacterium]|nr:TolC family protein [Dysgonamonadaceae bacterium]MDD3356827.1 TolC family protein [Dysgonamonadaceae bacterium]MDD3728437.1 TolC family protein [Dysgonamonadaceae bacterium]MDD4606519.1 TolC family protein [Dysgonamonadaceae bacterium]
MKRIILIITGFLLLTQVVNAQKELSFNNLDLLLKYAENNSVFIKTGEQQSLLAKWQKISAQAGLVNFRMQTNFNLTNNLELPVSFLPAEAFGGTPGTFKEVTMGRQYVGNLNLSPQIDIINPASWAKLKSANVNVELTNVNNLIAKKSLFESVSATYHNIISLQEQIEITQKSLLAADTLVIIMQNKYSEGIVRQQDLNDAHINQLTLSDNLEQLNLSLKQQYYSLKVLCDIPESTSINIDEQPDYDKQIIPGLHADNQLQYESSLLNVEMAKADLRTNRLMQFPTVSLVFYDSWQQNSNSKFFDSDVNWLNSQYVGLKVSVPFPDINRYTLTKSSRINQVISSINAEHTKLENDLTNKQLILDYEKAYSQLNTAKQIYQLKEQNYGMVLNQFNMSILSSDKLIIAFNDLLASRLNYSSALANLNYTLSKIEINNRVR